MYRNLWQFPIHQNDPTLRCIPAKRDDVTDPQITNVDPTMQNITVCGMRSRRKQM